MKRTAAPRRKRKAASTALILLNSKKIFAERMKVYKRRKKTLEQLEKQSAVFCENDEPEYRKFLAGKLGAEQTRFRELLSKIVLYQTRIEKIRDIASEKGILPGRYCWFLWKKVTPEHDFWYCLEEDIDAWQREEEIREERERIRYQKRREKRNDKPEDEWDMQDFADDFREMLSEEDDEDDMDFENFFEGFKQMFDGLSGRSNPCQDNSQQELKKLYRELCMKYHPDRTGVCDERTKRIWNDIQDAYETGNVDRLRTIRSDTDLAGGKRDLSHSELDDLIIDTEKRIRQLRCELREQKKNPWFGFASWDEKRRFDAEKEIRTLLNAQIAEEEKNLLHWKERLETLLHGWHPRSTQKHPGVYRNAAERKKRFRDQTGDLFDL